jgi:adenylylsulfate kinase
LIILGQAQRTVTSPAKTFWLTGLSGAGKSTIALALRERFVVASSPCVLLDGDVVRTGLCADLDFSPAGRAENIRRVAHVCRLFNDTGVTAVVALISPAAEDRQIARQIISPANFLEIYIATSLEVCESRDPKGLYSKARAGAIKEFTGISAPYEAPLEPTYRLDTANISVAECVAVLYPLANVR